MARFIEYQKDKNKLSVSSLSLNELLENSKNLESEADKTISSEIKDLVIDITKYIDSYQFNLAAEKLYSFAWHRFADYYIEASKKPLDGEGSKAKQTFEVLTSTFLIMLKLLHPFMPFITEDIFQKLWGEGDYLIISSWPTFEAKYLPNEKITE